MELSPESTGILINLVALVLAYTSVRNGAKRDKSELDDKNIKRHSENQELMTQIRLQLEGLKHLDPCMDEVKEELAKVRERLHKLEGSVALRESNIAYLIKELNRFRHKKEEDQ